MCWLLVEENEMFSFQQGLNGFQQGINGMTVRLIADSCQHLKKLRLGGYGQFVVDDDDDDVIHVIKKLGKQLTTLELCGEKLTDFAYSYLNNCVR